MRFGCIVFVLPLLLVGKLMTLRDPSVLGLMFLWVVALIHQERAAVKQPLNRFDKTQGWIALSSHSLTASSLIYFACFKTAPVSETMRWTGGILLLLGFGLRYWSLSVLGGNFSKTAFPNQQLTLIQQLPYSLIRHPAYLGALMFLTGQIYWLGATTSWNILMFLLTFCAYQYRIQIEEKQLMNVAHFNYAAYQQETWRLIPFVF